MMGLDQVKYEIIGHAEAEAKGLLAEAKGQVKRELEAAHTLVDQFEAELRAGEEKESAALEKKYAASMKMQAKKILFQKRKEILTELFAATREGLVKLPQAERQKMMMVLFQQAKTQCPVGTVYCAKQDIFIAKKLWKEAVATNILGGIIVENPTGTLRIDYSFDTLLQELEEKKLQEVAKLLFL